MLGLEIISIVLTGLISLFCHRMAALGTTVAMKDGPKTVIKLHTLPLLLVIKSLANQFFMAF